MRAAEEAREPGLIMRVVAALRPCIPPAYGDGQYVRMMFTRCYALLPGVMLYQLD